MAELKTTDTRLAVLEERSSHHVTKLNDFEDMMKQHILREESLLKSINDTLKEFSNSIDIKIEDATDPIAADLVPVKEAMTKFKGALTVLTFLGTGFVTLAMIFRESIEHFFHG